MKIEIDISDSEITHIRRIHALYGKILDTVDGVKKEKKVKKENSSKGNIIMDDEKYFFPITGERIYVVYQEEFNTFKRLYPNVDIMTEFKKMEGWLIANNLKTERGMPKFINRWLAKCQDGVKNNNKFNASSALTDMIKDNYNEHRTNPRIT